MHISGELSIVMEKEEKEWKKVEKARMGSTISKSNYMERKRKDRRTNDRVKEKNE